MIRRRLAACCLLLVRIISFLPVANAELFSDKRDNADVSTKEDFGKGVIKEDYEKKHTLESDEEEEEKYERLDMNKASAERTSQIQCIFIAGRRSRRSDRRVRR